MIKAVAPGTGRKNPLPDDTSELPVFFPIPNINQTILKYITRYIVGVIPAGGYIAIRHDYS